MTALERFKRNVLKAAWSHNRSKPPAAKRPHAKRPRTGYLGRVRGRMRNPFKRKGSALNEPLEPVDVSLETFRFMRQEVLHRISQGNGRSCTLFDAIEAIKSSDDVMQSYDHDRREDLGPAYWKMFRKESGLERKYNFMFALDEIEARPSACDERVTSWEEVQEALSEHMNFPDELLVNEEADFSDNPVERLVQRIDWDYRAKINQRLADSERRTQVVARSPLSPVQALDKTQLGLSESLDDQAEKRAERLITAELRSADERVLQEEREAEAQERASQLLRDLTPEEQEMVQNALFDIGPEDEVVAKTDTDVVTRKNMHTLQPGAWLSDEVVHFFLAMLAKRDEELCREDSTRSRSHFFKSFFMTKLTNEGHQNPSIAGTYEYRNVRRWSKKVPGKDIFHLDKIIFPINVGEVHWVCAVAFMQEKKIQYYDSFGGDGMHYLEQIRQYIKDEHEDKKKTPLPDAEDWQLVPCERDTPRQRNGYDCGVFTCMFADFISKDCPLVFGQDHVNQCRERIALSILMGKAIM